MEEKAKDKEYQEENMEDPKYSTPAEQEVSEKPRITQVTTEENDSIYEPCPPFCIPPPCLPLCGPPCGPARSRT